MQTLYLVLSPDIIFCFYPSIYLLARAIVGGLLYADGDLSIESGINIFGL